MDSAIEKLVLARDLGKSLGGVRLRGRIELPGGATATPWLVRTDRGAYLMATEDGYAAVKGPVPDVPVTFSPLKKGGTLEVDGLSAEVPSRLIADVLELLGLSKHQRAGAPGPPIETDPCIAPMTLVEHAVVAQELRPEEILLGFVPSRTEVPVESWALEQATGRAAVLLTADRILRLVISPVGDVVRHDVPPETVHAHEGGRVVVAGDLRLDTRDHEIRASRLGVLASLGPEDRMLECARLSFREGRDGKLLSRSRALLQHASRRGDPRADALAVMVAAELGEPDATFPEVDEKALGELSGSATVLADAYRTWALSPTSALALVEQLKTARCSLGLHAVARAELAPKQSKMEAALGDAALAEHAIVVEEFERAEGILTARLEQLQVTGHEQLEPRSAEVAARVAMRIRLLELLAVTRGRPDAPDKDAVQELARAEPLSTERLRELSRVAPASLAGRAEAALDVLERPPLSPPSPGSHLSHPRPLTDAELDRIHGPAPQDLSSRLASLQRVVAEPLRPDRARVIDYCEAIEPDVGVAGRALSDARTLLGLTGTQAYVSRGRSRIGIRAFEGEPPFLLVGCRHLDESDAAFLPLSALRAAFASELAHVRFDHGRVTADQVWEGALAKSRQGLEFVLSAVPVLQSLRAVGGVGLVASRLDQRSVQRALDGAERLNDIIGRAMSATRPLVAAPDTLSASNEQLIEAHRYLQLTADRVGLVAAGDLRSAVFAMIAVRPRYVDALLDLEDRSLLEILQEKTQATDRAFTDLALRVAGAIAFLLSDDFEEIRRTLQS